MSCEQQDMQSFADGSLQHKLDLLKWRVNEWVNVWLK